MGIRHYLAICEERKENQSQGRQPQADRERQQAEAGREQRMYLQGTSTPLGRKVRYSHGTSTVPLQPDRMRQAVGPKREEPGESLPVACLFLDAAVENN